MKLIVAIVQDYDCDRLLSTVTDGGLRATRIASTGGFLRTGNTTVLLGVEDDQVTACLDAISTCCRARVERRPDEFGTDYNEWSPAGTCEVTIGGAVAFVLTVEAFIKIPGVPAVEG